MSSTLQKLKCIVETLVEQNSIFQKKTEKSGSIQDILKETPNKIYFIKVKKPYSTKDIYQIGMRGSKAEDLKNLKNLV